MKRKMKAARVLRLLCAVALSFNAVVLSACGGSSDSDSSENNASHTAISSTPASMIEAVWEKTNNVPVDDFVIEVPTSFEVTTLDKGVDFYSNEYIVFSFFNFEGIGIYSPNSIDIWAVTSIESYMNERTDVNDAQYQVYDMPGFNKVMRYTYYHSYETDTNGDIEYCPSVEYYIVKNSQLYRAFFSSKNSISSNEYSQIDDKNQYYQDLIDFSDEFFKRVKDNSDNTDSHNENPSTTTTTIKQAEKVTTATTTTPAATTTTMTTQATAPTTTVDNSSIIEPKKPEKSFSQFTISGSGSKVTKNISLPPVLCVVHAEHNGSSNFIVHCYSESGNEIHLVNEIGVVNSYQIFNAQNNNNINGGMIEVDADGSWSLTFIPVVDYIGDTTQSAFSGYGNSVVGCFTANGITVCKGTHNGNSNFIVHIYEYSETGDRLLSGFNEIGIYSGETVLRTETGKKYFFEVIADGSWTLELE